MRKKTRGPSPDLSKAGVQLPRDAGSRSVSNAARRRSPSQTAGRTPGARSRALILFDFNGVLVDDETFHFQALRETVGARGVCLTRRDYDTRYMTGDDAFALHAVLGDAGHAPSGADVAALVRRKRAAYRRLVGGAPQIAPANARLVRALARRATLGIVSSGARREIERSLDDAGLRQHFATIVAAGDSARPKPYPDPYRLALKRLRRPGGGSSSGLSRSRVSAARRWTAADGNVLVIEDSAGGIRAARSAGLPVILGVATTRPASALKGAGAIRIVRSLADLEIADVLALLDRPPSPRARGTRKRGRSKTSRRGLS